MSVTLTTGSAFVPVTSGRYFFTRRSTEAYVFRLFGAVVDWHFCRQNTVTTSTTETELLSFIEKFNVNQIVNVSTAFLLVWSF